MKLSRTRSTNGTPQAPRVPTYRQLPVDIPEAPPLPLDIEDKTLAEAYVAGYRVGYADGYRVGYTAGGDEAPR